MALRQFTCDPLVEMEIEIERLERMKLENTNATKQKASNEAEESSSLCDIIITNAKDVPDLFNVTQEVKIMRKSNIIKPLPGEQRKVLEHVIMSAQFAEMVKTLF